MYIYQADTYCDDCGESIRDKLNRQGKAPEDPSDECTYDSSEYPKGPCEPDESDYPQHCAGCREFLENPLTEYGLKYVKDTLCESLGSGSGVVSVLREWADFYDITLDDLLDSIEGTD